MRTFAALILLLATLPPVPAALAGENAQASNPVFGYLNPQTDVFTPQAQPAAPTPAAAPINRKGTLVVTVTVAIDASVPATASFQASLRASTADITYNTSVSRSGAVTRSGNSGKVVLKLPYVFTVSSATDVVTLDFQMTGSTGAIISLTETIPLPVNGATTAVAISQKV